MIVVDLKLATQLFVIVGTRIRVVFGVVELKCEIIIVLQAKNNNLKFFFLLKFWFLCTFYTFILN